MRCLGAFGHVIFGATFRRRESCIFANLFMFLPPSRSHHNETGPN